MVKHTSTPMLAKKRWECAVLHLITYETKEEFLMKIKAIAAMDEGRVIGIKNSLPWDIPEDMRYFVRLTKGHSVLMGRKTFESTPLNSKPLPKRLNIVVTRSPEKYQERESLHFISDPIEFLEKCKSGEISLPSDELWVIGGSHLYEQTMPLWDEAHITLIKGRHEGDAYFPPFEDTFELVSKEEIEPCIFRHFKKK